MYATDEFHGRRVVDRVGQRAESVARLPSNRAATSSPNGDAAKRLVDGVFFSVIGFRPKVKWSLHGTKSEVVGTCVANQVEAKRLKFVR